MRRRLDLVVILAVVFPLLVALALAVTRPDASRIVAKPPTSVPLSAAELVCPAAPGGDKQAATLAVGSAAGAGISGQASVRAGASTETRPLADQQVSRAAAPPAAAVITATGDVAPGLVAMQSATSPLSVADCAPPTDSLWFTGVGAGPTQASVLELSNPNSGPAVADVEVLGDSGVVDVPELRGIAVAARATVELDLGKVIPSTATLALHVSVIRGQLGIAVRDRGERLTGGTSTEDWLAAQATPSQDNLMLGLQPGSGRHTLAIANPGDDQVTATVKLLTTDASFAPDGLDPIEIAPHSVARTILDDLLASKVADGAVGLEIESTAPVTASLRSVVSGDLSFLVPGPTVTTDTTALVPGTAGRLVLAGARAVGVATVTTRKADGTQISSQRVELGPDRAATVTIPASAASVQVVPERTPVQGAVLLTGDGGSALVRLRDLQRTGSVPAVTFGP